MPEIIRDIETNHGRIEKADFIRFAFGAHHFVEIEECDGRVMFRVGQTHHGIQLDATEVGSDLEALIFRLQNELVDTKSYSKVF